MSISMAKRSFNRITQSISNWGRTHIITTVIVGLCICWILISWIVYSFEASAKDATITTFGRSLWWGIVTFLTVGYGDYVPVTLGGRVWAGILMVFGVFGVAIITSRISSYFLEEALREGRGLVNTEKLKDHFIVCGWKEDMHLLLTHILDFNPGLRPGDLVVIAEMSPSAVDTLRENPENPKLKGVHVIIGNPSETMNLERAAPQRARKVLILADRTPNANGALPSVVEVDARTIMIAMTLASLARGTLVAAEILDPKMDQYLRLASVGEIIYSREYSRLLLGNAAGGTGIANIIFDLLDPKTSTKITTLHLSESYINTKYGEFKKDFEESHANMVVIGILENTGSSQHIKELALRQAQKTPDMQRLLQNLKSVKQLRCNHPAFNPAADYVVTEGSMAIVIETQGDSGLSEIQDFAHRASVV